MAIEVPPTESTPTHPPRQLVLDHDGGLDYRKTVTSRTPLNKDDDWTRPIATKTRNSFTD